MVVAQPLLDDRLLFGTEAELLGASARITNGQYPDRVALSVSADGTTGTMSNDAVEQGAADDFGGEREGRREFGTLAEGCFLICLIVSRTTARVVRLKSRTATRR